MLPRYNLWGLCLLGGAAAEMSYLVARANTAVASESTTAFASISNLANLCGLAAPENTTSETDSSNTVIVTCSDCTTVSGVVVGTAVPSNLIPTDQTASFSDGENNKRAQLTAMPRETLMSRAPAALPLAEPDPNHQADFMMAIKESIPIDSLFNMQINPNVFQLHQWRIPLQINGKTVQTPVGVVSEFQRWPTNSAANYKMEEMSGCTGIFIVGNSGFYAVHFWESTRPDNVNGGSSFNYRYGTGKNDVMIRPLADFKAIAVDIFKQRSPSGAKNFLSLVDLREIHDDPFSEANGGGDVYIITRAAGPSKTQQTTQMYPSQIAALTSVIRRYIKVNSINIRTYIGDKTTFKGDPPVSPVGVPKDLNGVTILQYSPYAGKNSNGCPEARARIWEEVNTSPAVDRKWPSTMPGLNKRDGAACGLSSPTTSTSEPDC